MTHTGSCLCCGLSEAFLWCCVGIDQIPALVVCYNALLLPFVPRGGPRGGGGGGAAQANSCPAAQAAAMWLGAPLVCH